MRKKHLSQPLDGKLRLTLKKEILIDHNYKIIYGQECIPVVCVPPARLPYVVVSDSGGLSNPPKTTPRMENPLDADPPCC